ncbi:uncharacterized protein L201_004839 [Kwoniella dendrophila CBS 6074]|uniref:F-box domain-containing protein n=1 Tax=Kwoniella dendrophila CBS 6074 TaxID=1295534 RepID=A0AAX4JZD5_9TREE
MGIEKNPYQQDEKGDLPDEVAHSLSPPPYQSTISLNTQVPPYQTTISLTRYGGPSTVKKYKDEQTKEQKIDFTLDSRIWSKVIPYLDLPSLDNISRTCKSLYGLSISSLWKAYTLKSDDQLWFILNTLRDTRVKGKGKGRASFYLSKLGSRFSNSGSVKEKSKNPEEDNSLFRLSNSDRVRYLASLITTIIFDTIPSPTITALIPFHLIPLNPKSYSDLMKRLNNEFKPSGNQEEEDYYEWSKIILFPNVKNVRFSEITTLQILKYDYKPFQYFDYYETIDDLLNVKGNMNIIKLNIDKKLPNKYSQLSFSHLVNPIKLFIDLPNTTIRNKDGSEIEKYSEKEKNSWAYDDLFGDNILDTGLSIFIRETLKEIHINLNLDIMDEKYYDGSDLKCFLYGKKHYLYLPLDLFNYISKPVITQTQEHVSSSFEKGDIEKLVDLNYENQSNELYIVDKIVDFCMSIIKNDIRIDRIGGHDDDDDDEDNDISIKVNYVIDYETKWIIRYSMLPKNLESNLVNQIMKKAEKDLISRLSNGEIEDFDCSCIKPKSKVNKSQDLHEKEEAKDERCLHGKVDDIEKEYEIDFMRFETSYTSVEYE